MVKYDKKIKRNLQILFERKILSRGDKRDIDKSKCAFYGCLLIFLSLFGFSFATSFFFFNIHPYITYYFIIIVELVPLYILFKYFQWVSLERFKYS